MARRTPKRRGKSEAPPPKKESSRTPFLIDVASILLMGFSLFAFVSFLLFQSKGLESSRWLGSFGVALGSLLERWLGVGSFALVLWGAVLSFSLLREGKFSAVKLRSFLALPFVLTSLASLLSISSGFYSGGLLGLRIGVPLESALGKVGGIITTSLVLVISLAISSGMGVTEFVGSSAKTSAQVGATSSNILWRTFVFVLRTTLELLGLFAWIVKSVFSFGKRAASSETIWDKDLEEPLPKPRRRKNTVPTEEVEKTEEIEDIPTHVVVKRRVNASQVNDKKKKASKLPETEYVHPDIKYLTPGEPVQAQENDDELLAISKQIESKLRDFSIAGRVTEVHPGPVVTLFEFEPAPGVKVGRIAALQDDISMSLRASSIRIVAPIPKKGTVGIEVPNRHRDVVRLRDVLESDTVMHSDSILTVPIGKDTYGEPVAVDITNMPHLLIAGATGTGKSVCINTILLSLLYRSSPKDLGLILIDPKILELSVYEGIPHLRVPVVTVPKQAKAVLDWAAREMDRRYRLMQRFGVRSIDGYNRVVSGEDEGAKENSSNVIELAEHRIVAEGTVGKATPEETDNLFQEELQPLPKIVIVIDELADLMLTVGREVEELITRLAQKARAAGIHLIVATQRPSVDVITGLIKANFPARLSFRVASRIDSRTILDSMGAEKLLGRGDMLFLQPGGGAPKRIHGAFVSDAEVKKVIEAVKRNGPPAFDERIIEVCERALKEDTEASSSGEYGSDEYDSVYDKAVELVVQKGQASTSMLQRAFRIGYNRAARIIEMMERDGIVGPMDGVKPREVLLAQSE